MPVAHLLLLLYLAVIMTVMTERLGTLTGQGLRASVEAVTQATKVREDLVAAQALQVRLLQVICFNTTVNPVAAQRCIEAPGSVEPTPKVKAKTNPPAPSSAPARSTPWWHFWDWGSLGPP